MNDHPIPVCAFAGMVWEAQPPANFGTMQAEWERLKGCADTLNYKDGWAEFRFKEQFGQWPVLAGRTLVDVQTASLTEKHEVYRTLARKLLPKGKSLNAISGIYKGTFGAWPPWEWRDEFREEVVA